MEGPQEVSVHLLRARSGVRSAFLTFYYFVANTFFENKQEAFWLHFCEAWLPNTGVKNKQHPTARQEDGFLTEFSSHFKPQCFLGRGVFLNLNYLTSSPVKLSKTSNM